jgi:hypothetical protein
MFAAVLTVLELASLSLAMHDVAFGLARQES